MQFIGIIPARFASTRFPGKPLADIGGKSMIQRVYEQAEKVFETVYVATDDDRIHDAVVAFGGNVVMTDSAHQSGTDRCAEALHKVEEQSGKSFEVVVNIQGDEPFVQPEQLERIKHCFNEAEAQIATLVKPLKTQEAILNPNQVKVVIAKNGDALYFSRSPIPFIRNRPQTDWYKSHEFLGHIGLYAYRADILSELTNLPIGELESLESLEQLRWLENGYRIQTRKSDHDSVGIDTPEDLQRILDHGIESFL